MLKVHPLAMSNFDVDLIRKRKQATGSLQKRPSRIIDKLLILALHISLAKTWNVFGDSLREAALLKQDVK